MGFCRHLLESELQVRKNKNAQYSLRAFARDLGIGTTSLSDVLADKRKLSAKNIQKIGESLELNEKELQKIFEELREFNRLISPEEEVKNTITDQDFSLISDWYYFAILNLAKVENTQGEAKEISYRLGLDIHISEMALLKLIKMELISIEDGYLKRTSKPLTTSYDTPSEAIVTHHKGKLALASKALDHTDLKDREFGSKTLAINPKKLEKAKLLLRKSLLKVEKILETGELTEVYTLNHQLFPLRDWSQKNEHL